LIAALGSGGVNLSYLVISEKITIAVALIDCLQKEASAADDSGKAARK
jgi:hypothetical protein